MYDRLSFGGFPAVSAFRPALRQKSLRGQTGPEWIFDGGPGSHEDSKPEPVSFLESLRMGDPRGR